MTEHKGAVGTPLVIHNTRRRKEPPKAYFVKQLARRTGRPEAELKKLSKASLMNLLTQAKHLPPEGVQGQGDQTTSSPRRIDSSDTETAN